MSFTQKPQNFPTKITDKIFAHILLQHFVRSTPIFAPCSKHIEAVIVIPAKTASTWIEA